MPQPFISICIPAYKNKTYLKRLLDSISGQSFMDFEVIITDDSPDTSLYSLIELYKERMKIDYSRNQPALGSPANWNAGIAKANGEWIKIMHDDDWFADKNSLAEFAKAAQHTNTDFIFSGFTNVDLKNGIEKRFVINNFHEWMLKGNPLYLFRTNYIGHPSTTLIRNKKQHFFDEKTKWVVDFDFYIRVLRSGGLFYTIRKPLINIGVSDEQITKAVFRQREVEIPENLYLLNKLGINSLNNIFVFDYYWRLMRNLRITSAEELKKYLNEKQVPSMVSQMIRYQQKLGIELLKKSGIYSKLCMGLLYLFYRLGLTK